MCAQSCPTPCDPMTCSPPGSSVNGSLQARILEWVAISFSSPWKWSHSVVSNSSRPHELQPTRLLHPWDFPGKNTGVGCHCLLRVGCIDIYNCYIFLLDWSLDHYVVSFLISCIFFILRSVLSDMRIATPAFFCFLFAWNIFFHPLTFSLYVSWGLKSISCR